MKPSLSRARSLGLPLGSFLFDLFQRVDQLVSHLGQFIAFGFARDGVGF